jgi:hypothetical protein
MRPIMDLRDAKNNERKKSLKMLSDNEEHCMRMNILAKNNSNKLVFIHDRHSRHRRRILTDVIDELERTDEFIRLSTGSLFSPEEAALLEQQARLKEQRKKQQQPKNTLLAESQELKNSLRISPRLTKSLTDLNASSLSLPGQFKSKKFNFQNPRKQQDDELVSASIGKFLDKRNKVSYKINRNEMRLIECKHSAFRSIEAAQKRYMPGNLDPNDSDFQFMDDDAYGRYVSLCEQRDSIPEMSKRHVEELKKRDPVFARRYTEFVNLRAKYRAPRVDLTERVYLPPMPKLVLSRNKERYIKEMSYQQRVNLPMMKMHDAIERSKNFMRSIEVYNML